MLTFTILSLDTIGRALAGVLADRHENAAPTCHRGRGPHMIGFILRRLVQLLPVLLIASTGIWAMIYAVPGTPIGTIVGENATPEQIQAAIVRLGLDQPMLVQYWTWLRNALIGDFGVSIQNRESVLDLIMHRIPATLQLGLSATVVGLLLGVPVAVISALQPGSWLDRCSAAGAHWHWACRPSGSASC